LSPNLSNKYEISQTIKSFCLVPAGKKQNEQERHCTLMGGNYATPEHTIMFSIDHECVW